LFDLAQRKPLPTLTRRTLDANTAGWVRREPMGPDGAGPLALTTLMPGLDLAEWASSNLPSVLGDLHKHGAVLFRGFGITDAARFERVTRAVAGEPLSYEERSSPRSAVAGRVYTSTDHPADQAIFLHNEQSYNLTFPLRLLFCCVTPATDGGATPLADSRRVFARLPAALRDKFLSRGYAYVRNFGDRLGLPWQQVFGTSDRDEVVRYCSSHGIDWEWRPDGGLRTRQVRRAAGRHPFTGEPVWFNHATFFHVTTLPGELGRTLVDALGEEGLPNQTTYGDGEAIEPDVLDVLRATYAEERTEFPWQRGDVLLLDNMLTSHGRAPFAGPRLVLASMTTPLPWSSVPHVGDLKESR
jgi:alpha-ketoglutarate-dependent taurine dioxygenase